MFVGMSIDLHDYICSTQWGKYGKRHRWIATETRKDEIKKIGAAASVEQPANEQSNLKKRLQHSDRARLQPISCSNSKH
jgi:hypothetical protein